MKNYIYIVIVLVVLQLNVSAQQITQSNFYTQNLFALNPAATGIQGNVAGYLNFKDQWSGLKGAPESFGFGLHSMVNHSMGLGLNIEQNEAGVYKQFITELNYSYRVLLSEDQSLAFGLKAGISQNSLNYQIMEASDKTDPTLYSSSPIINESLIRTGAGLHYNRKNLNVHLSSPLLYGQQEKEFMQTMYGFASYDFYFSENIWKIQPSVLYRYTKSSANQFDVNILGEWDKKVWGMLSYRSNKNALAGFGFFLKGIGLGYVYEINRSQFSSISSGSHEIMIYFESGFSLSKKDPHFKSSKRNLDRN